MIDRPFGWNTLGRLWYWVANTLLEKGIISGYSIYPYRIEDYEKRR